MNYFFPFMSLLLTYFILLNLFLGQCDTFVVMGIDAIFKKQEQKKNYTQNVPAINISKTKCLYKYDEVCQVYMIMNFLK